MDRKRLFFDIETSPNIYFGWRCGYDLKITHECIIEERAIICICWRWAGQKAIHTLKWDWDSSEPDKEMLKKFMPVLLSADEAIGHNSDRFDVKWLRTRCLLYRIPFPPQITTVDTLKAAKGYFLFNSNKLDYIGKYCGFGGKADKGGFQTWYDIALYDDQPAMRRMVRYCKHDVWLLEQIFNLMNPYLPAKTALSCEARACPECDAQMVISKTRMTAAGYKQAQLRCKECGKYNTVAASRVTEDD